MRKPRVFIDADVLFAAAASPSSYGASLTVLRMAEITLIECLTSEQVTVEVERNLEAKLPVVLPGVRILLHKCLRVVPDPLPADLAPYTEQADPKDLPLLVAALREQCDYFLTFNVRHYHPVEASITVQQPGDFLKSVRNWLSMLTSNGDAE